MKNYTISIQRGLSDVSDLLKKEGYNVCYMGQCGTDADIAVIDVPDYEYEGIGPAECRIIGSERKMFVINSANYSPNEIVDLIKRNKCC